MLVCAGETKCVYVEGILYNNVYSTYITYICNYLPLCI